MSYLERIRDVLVRTNNGDDLVPHDRGVLIAMRDAEVREETEAAFTTLYENDTKPNGYTPQWLHGIKHVTKTHDGYVRWKGLSLDHFSYNDEAREHRAVIRLGTLCTALEERGIVVSAQAYDAISAEFPTWSITEHDIAEACRREADGYLPSRDECEYRAAEFKYGYEAFGDKLEVHLLYDRAVVSPRDDYERALAQWWAQELPPRSYWALPDADEQTLREVAPYTTPLAL